MLAWRDMVAAVTGDANTVVMGIPVLSLDDPDACEGVDGESSRPGCDMKVISRT
jgi:hypothetical protein